MSFGGHVNDMLNRVKQNAALKNARKGKFKGGNDYSHTKYSKTTYDLPELSEEELTKVKQKIKDEAKEDQKKQKIIWVSGALILLILLLIFNFITF
ncbi:hypothetical protein [Lutibacter citreus]|uniref:hypothetical protein n=1 Tax=Lutibacter citreus TaxID=2138210 RepID=UPI000DBE9036|nr:hypothetical protein [Lutibacter citreus]